MTRPSFYLSVLAAACVWASLSLLALDIGDVFVGVVDINHYDTEPPPSDRPPRVVTEVTDAPFVIGDVAGGRRAAASATDATTLGAANDTRGPQSDGNRGVHNATAIALRVHKMGAMAGDAAAQKESEESGKSPDEIEMNVKQEDEEEEGSVSDDATYSPTHSPTAAPDYFMELFISPDAQSLGADVAPEYVSATLDWWKLGTEGWGNASVINANLNHPDLIAAAKGLSPWFLRIGGSQADEIMYDIPRTNRTIGSRYDRKVASHCKSHPQKCLTKERWDQVLDFASKTGARIVFTVAYVLHTRDDEGHNDRRDWDSRNARQLLEYTATTHAQRGTVFGFELGNELRHKGKVKNVTRIANAYKELRRLVHDVFRGYNSIPKILGPASTGRDETAALVPHIAPFADIVTYHKYHGRGTDPKLSAAARHPTFQQHPVKQVGPGEAVEHYMANRSEAPHLWIGEGAMAHNSGRRGVTDTFLGSMWYANLLGVLAKTKPMQHSVYCRQALIGGYYELVSHETLVPNPDYWISYVWKHIVGTRAVGPIQSPQRKDSVERSARYTFGCCWEPGWDTVLIHSFCAAPNNGDVVLIIINISENQPLMLNVTMGISRTEYLLRPNEDGLKSRQVLLNGQLMFIENGTLPEIDGAGIRREAREQLEVPPTSVSFVVVHGSGVERCLRRANLKTSRMLTGVDP